MNWRQRSYEKELLDGDAIPFEDIRRNMEELDFINHWLGGHRITRAGMRTMTTLAGSGLAGGRTAGNPLRVCEIGCGGGDNLRVIRNWCSRRGIPVELLGIDINPSCIRFAAGRLPEADFMVTDYRLAEFERKPDIIFSSLFCHHFNEGELTEQLKWMQEHSRVGFFINDLHRNRFAWLAIKMLTRLFSGSALVKNDAPLSVKRGFSRQEWKMLLSGAGLSGYEINWKWAFRWLITAPS